MITSIILFLNMGGGEMLLVVLFILLFFGSKNLPELARGLGKATREMKDAMNGVQQEFQREMNTIEEQVKKETEPLKEIGKGVDISKDIDIDAK